MDDLTLNTITNKSLDRASQTIHFARKINNIHTEVTARIFQDQLFISITQLNKFGTVIEVTQSEATHASNVSKPNRMQVNVRLGRRDDPLALVYARHLMERFGEPLKRNLLLAIALTDRTRATFEVVMENLRLHL